MKCLHLLAVADALENTEETPEESFRLCTLGYTASNVIYCWLAKFNGWRPTIRDGQEIWDFVSQERSVVAPGYPLPADNYTRLASVALEVLQPKKEEYFAFENAFRFYHDGAGRDYLVEALRKLYHGDQSHEVVEFYFSELARVTDDLNSIDKGTYRRSGTVMGSITLNLDAPGEE